MQIARRRGMKKAIVALARRLAVIVHRISVDGTDSAGPGKPQQHEGHIRSCDRRKTEIHRGVERCPSRDDG